VEFNNFELSKAICEYDLPVLSAIGHSTNQSIVELVSNKHFITPTDLANFIVERFKQCDLQLGDYKKFLDNKLLEIHRYIENKNNNLYHFKSAIYQVSKQLFVLKKESRCKLKNSLIFIVNTLIKQEKEKLRQKLDSLKHYSEAYLK